MNNDNPFKLDFDSYILQSEPEQQENGKLWQTAIGLQLRGHVKFRQEQQHQFLLFRHNEYENLSNWKAKQNHTFY